MKKLASSTLAAILVSLILVSCGESASSSAPGQTASADGGNASADETTAPSSPDGLAPADFEGYDFRIASCEFFAQIGDHVPQEMYDELDKLEKNLRK